MRGYARVRSIFLNWDLLENRVYRFPVCVVHKQGREMDVAFFRIRLPCRHYASDDSDDLNETKEEILLAKLLSFFHAAAYYLSCHGYDPPGYRTNFNCSNNRFKRWISEDKNLHFKVK